MTRAPRGNERDAYLLALGRRLRTLREQRGLTQEACGRASGVGADVISRLENGRYTSPGLRTLLRVAQGLGVRVSELLPDGPEPTRGDAAVRQRISRQLSRSDPEELELIETLISAVLQRRRR